MTTSPKKSVFTPDNDPKQRHSSGVHNQKLHFKVQDKKKYEGKL